MAAENKCGRLNVKRSKFNKRRLSARFTLEIPRFSTLQFYPRPHSNKLNFPIISTISHLPNFLSLPSESMERIYLGWFIERSERMEEESYRPGVIFDIKGWWGHAARKWLHNLATGQRRPVASSALHVWPVCTRPFGLADDTTALTNSPEFSITARFLEPLFPPNLLFPLESTPERFEIDPSRRSFQRNFNRF